MDVQIQPDPKFARIDTLFILLAEKDRPLDRIPLPDDLRGEIRGAIERSGFEGRMDEGITILATRGPKKIALIGLGKESQLTVRVAKAAAHGIGKISRRNRSTSIAVAFPYTLPDNDPLTTTRLFTDFLIHADYRYEAHLTVRDLEPALDIKCVYIPPSSVSSKDAKRIATEATAIAEGVRTVRDLGNGPGNEVTPTRLAERAVEVARQTGLTCKVFDKKQIEKMKMGGLLAVNRGSAQEPRFVILEHAPRKAKRTVCIVGKGITFDSGGISIKPSERMEEMKFDMCGAAAVIGTMQTVGRLELPVHVIGIFAATENLPSGTAYKPGDIVKTMSGKTVEIVNTDAEGRMILSDALHYASTLRPDHIIDFATLTGACVVALGNEASGLFSNDSDLARKLIESGEKVGERLWRMPEWEEYKEQIRSEWADVKNSGGRWAGAVTAAVFLGEFVDCPSWAHIDIAGTAWTESETARERRGATGIGVRLMVRFLESLA
ncbi:MAG TPA: leucyl aminopeptidase [Thermoanaerobaculia bacterium]|nr:leucyl aminopeptidase [Thermoanaerobaculia bacterium]